MAGNAFIKFEGADGESMQKDFEKQIEISDFTWEITNDTSFTKGGGASVGKANPGTASFSQAFNKASPVMMMKIVSGKHFPTVVMSLCKNTGAETHPQEVYYQMTMESVYITKVGFSAGEDGVMTQSIDIVFKKVKVGYKMQTNTGSLDKEIPFTWDIPTMTVS
jgi:type VI secretion system Hcp family effector